MYKDLFFKKALLHEYFLKGDNMDSILARLDDRLRKFSGAEEPAKGEVGDSAAVQMDQNGEVNGETRVPDARQNGEAREQVEDQENGAKSEPNGSNGSHENGNSDRILSVESGGEEETSHLSEPDSDSEAPKSPDLPSPPSPLERPNRAPSASSFRSKK